MILSRSFRAPFLLRALAIAALVAASPSGAAAGQDGPDLRTQFVTLDEAGDHAGVVELWRENRYQALYVIDSFLEGSLALIEKATDEAPDTAEIGALHERARRGARAADEAFGTAIFVDYTSSFVGWTRDQQKRFRAGQAAFGASREAHAAGDLEKALVEARKCVELAEPLGDWWGTAMGLGIEGGLLVQLGKHEQALVPLSRARLLNHELGLAGSEYSALRSLTVALTEAGRTSRARAAAEAGIVLAELVGDEAGAAELRERLEAL